MLNIAFNDTEVQATRKAFKTGSIGYGFYGKVVIEGKRYQVSCNVIEIGSKPLPGETRTASGALLGEPDAQ